MVAAASNPCVRHQCWYPAFPLLRRLLRGRVGDLGEQEPGLGLEALGHLVEGAGLIGILLSMRSPTG